jgi:hypothetical protein
MRPYSPVQFLRVSECDAYRFDIHRKVERRGESELNTIDTVMIFQLPFVYIVMMMDFEPVTGKRLFDDFIRSIQVA